MAVSLSGLVRYALRRGDRWICAPKGDGPAGQIIPPVLTVDDDLTIAWLSPSLDQALDRVALLRMCWGLSAEVRAIP